MVPADEMKIPADEQRKYWDEKQFLKKIIPLMYVPM